MSNAEPADNGKKQTFEFEHTSNARSRAIATDEHTARELVAEATQCNETDFELVETYDPGDEPADDIHVTGHPFTDGDRIRLPINGPARDLEMTVQYPEDILQFTKETSPSGLKTLANRDFSEGSRPSWRGYRAENTLQRLYANGWRRVK